MGQRDRGRDGRAPSFPATMMLAWSGELLMALMADRTSMEVVSEPPQPLRPPAIRAQGQHGRRTKRFKGRGGQGEYHAVATPQHRLGQQQGPPTRWGDTQARATWRWFLRWEEGGGRAELKRARMHLICCPAVDTVWFAGGPMAIIGRRLHLRVWSAAGSASGH